MYSQNFISKYNSKQFSNEQANKLSLKQATLSPFVIILFSIYLFNWSNSGSTRKCAKIENFVV
jgi:hypothetical protein